MPGHRGPVIARPHLNPQIQQSLDWLRGMLAPRSKGGGLPFASLAPWLLTLDDEGVFEQQPPP